MKGRPRAPDSTSSQISEYVVSHPGKTCPEIAEALKITVKNVSSHLHNLLLSKRVVRMGTQREYHYLPGPNQEKMVEAPLREISRWDDGYRVGYDDALAGKPRRA